MKEGQPKIEGNPDHPNNRPTDFPAEDPIRDPRGSSATDIFTQASILSLYDPDRSPTLTFREDIQTWTAFVGQMRSLLDEQRPKQGAGIRFFDGVDHFADVWRSDEGVADGAATGEVASV